MVTFTTHTSNTIDFSELAQVTDTLYAHCNIPRRHGDNLSDITASLKRECPDFVVVAREGDQLRGWAGIYYQSRARANLIGWHPLVYPSDVDISHQLVRTCIEHVDSTSRSRMDVLLLNLSSKYREQAMQYGMIYTAVGMVLGAEWLSMEANLKQLDFSYMDLPSGFTIRPLHEIPDEELWSCFDSVFVNGIDPGYAKQPIEQRRESFDTYFCRKSAMDYTASLALIDNASIVGFVMIVASSGNGYVNGVGIVPAYRRRGLARFLLGTSMLRACENGLNTMILQVASNNGPGLGLYRKLGYKRVDKGWISYYWEKAEP